MTGITPPRLADRLRREQSELANFISGPADEASRTRYAATVLRRLLFLAFVSSAGQLDCNDLRRRFEQRPRSRRVGSFYRRVLLPLFHEFPLAGYRLLEPLDLERARSGPDVADEAFPRLFDLLDGYEWRLERGRGATDHQATPEVLGQLVEKSLHRRDIGAYYTDEDITEYISRNTIIPALLDAVFGPGPEAYTPDGAVGRLLAASPECYLFPTQRPSAHGQQPPEIAARLDDLITLNLDVRGLTSDLLATCAVPTLRRFQEALSRLTILDPTCGAGAFLLAALDVLVPLYEACLSRFGSTSSEAEPPRRFAAVRLALANNLYGVDLMPEAVEVCKLRLFLRLLAAAASGDQMADVPVALSIHCGNALVGSLGEGQRGSPRQGELAAGASPRPFHWGQAFPEVLQRGGFDVILGNPPYVEHARGPRDYEPHGYRTASCGNLYAFVMERALTLLGPRGRLGMIVPHSAFCTDRMAPLMALFDRPMTTWVSTYDIRPSKLFAGVDQRLAISLTAPATTRTVFATRYHRWYEPERPGLFERLRYADVTALSYDGAIAKAGTAAEVRLVKKLETQTPLGDDLGGPWPVYYHNAPRYWVRAMTFAPYFFNERDGEKRSAQVKVLGLPTAEDAAVVAAVLNSSLFAWWFVLFSDSRHLNRREIDRFPLGLRAMRLESRRRLVRLCERLMTDYRRHAVRKECHYRTTGRVIYDEFYPGKSKRLLDAIDAVLAEHFGLSEAERDFVINYDIKYRLGAEEG